MVAPNSTRTWSKDCIAADLKKLKVSGWYDVTQDREVWRTICNSLVEPTPCRWFFALTAPEISRASQGSQATSALLPGNFQLQPKLVRSSVTSASVGSEVLVVLLCTAAAEPPCQTQNSSKYFQIVSQQPPWIAVLSIAWTAPDASSRRLTSIVANVHRTHTVLRI